MEHTLNRYQEKVLNEIMACHKLTHMAFDDRNVPVEIVEFLAKFVNNKLEKLSKNDLKAVTEAFAEIVQ
jgi:ribose 5-phosphate isomerase